ncbi:MAG: NIPSNAP family protein [Bacteroidales bacterium]
MKKIVFLLLASVLLQFAACDTQETRDYYQLKMYRLSNTDQESLMDQYLENAYLPALERAGIPKVGVFKPREVNEGEQNYIMVLIPFSSLEEFETLDKKLEQDEAYQKAGKEYIEAPHDAPPYERIESFLLKAFSATPHLSVPEHNAPNTSRVYELRSYESATELLHRRKVEMFNEGESELFEKLGFQPVFFGQALSSAHIPHLMYMTTFSDTTSQQEHWDAFGNHPDWQEMKEIERYQNTVSNITKYLMYPTDYSDI